MAPDLDTDATSIARRQFSSARKGFDQDEVRAYLRELADTIDRLRRSEAEQRARAEAAESRATKAEDLDASRLVELLGEETARVLDAGRAASADIRRKAEESAERLITEANAEAHRLRAENEAALTRRRSEVDVELEAMRAEAANELDRRRAEGAELLAEIRQAAQAEADELVDEAQVVRRRILGDLARRRRSAREQLERLNAARERLLAAYDVVRRTVDEATSELTVALPEAKLAGDTASRRVSDEPEPSVDELEGLVTMARIAGLIEPSSLPLDPVLDDDLVADPEPAPPEPVPSPVPAPVRPSPPPVVARPEPAPPVPVPVEVEPEAAAAVEAAVDEPVDDVEDVHDVEPEPEPEVEPEVDTVDEVGAWAEDVEVDEVAEALEAGHRGDEGDVDGVAADGFDAYDDAYADEYEAAEGDHDGDHPEADAEVEAGTDEWDDEGYDDEPDEAYDEAPATTPTNVDALFARLKADAEAARVQREEHGDDAAGGGVAVLADEDDGGPGADDDGGHGEYDEHEAYEDEDEDDGPQGDEAFDERYDDGPAGEGAHAEVDDDVVGDDEVAGDGDAGEQGLRIVPESYTRGAVAHLRPDRFDAPVPAEPAPAAHDDHGHHDDDHHHGHDDHDGDVSYASDPVAGDEDLVAQRDSALASVEHELGRRLKRVLADEQNEVLDLLRRTKPSTSDDLLAAIGGHTVRYTDAARDELGQAALWGAASVGGEPDGSYEALAVELAQAVVEPLRERIARSFLDAGGDLDDVTGRLRSLYREWKGQRIAAAVRHYAVAAYAQGAYGSMPDGTPLRWLVDRTSDPCPDADDNALAGAVCKGEAFPTGDHCPPAHAGCRCMVVPAE